MNIIKSFLVVFFVWAVVSGCAGSKPETGATGNDNADGQYDEIEQLLGITPEDKTTAQPSQADDDDLLTLLQQSENSAATETEMPPAPQETQKAAQLEAELNDLQKQLRDKNKTINNLKEQVKVLEEGQPQSPGSGFSAAAAQPGISDAEYERTYNDAYQLAHQRKFRDAIRVFESLIASNPTIVWQTTLNIGSEKAITGWVITGLLSLLSRRYLLSRNPTKMTMPSISLVFAISN